MIHKVPFTELGHRMARFRARMDVSEPEWQLAVLFGRLNQYYFTGTMQDGLLLIPREEEAVYMVRRDLERGRDESLFSGIEPMTGFRDVAGRLKRLPERIHLETGIVTLGILQRFQKYFPAVEVKSADPVMTAVRSIKSPYELDLMKRAGRIHQRIMEERVPEILREGISEAQFASELFPVMVAEGHQGIARFGMFQSEMGVGVYCFGESALYPSHFDGPGGGYGMSPAVPLLGSRDRRLARGDLVYVDFCCGVEGYHSDKTMTYMFGASPPTEVREAQEQCVAIQNRVADLLRPGAVPSEIYNKVMGSLTPDIMENFMGYGKRRARFLGHGVGLQVDEQPVIAKGFDEPLEEGMVLAVEPKKGLEGVGMVGIENTFLVTAEGGRSLTGNHPGLLRVG